jgi:serine protease Do
MNLVTRFLSPSGHAVRGGLRVLAALLVSGASVGFNPAFAASLSAAPSSSSEPSRSDSTAPEKPARPDSVAAESAVDASRVKALTRANDAVVGVQVEAVEDAPSTKSLGRLRAGSGVVIDHDGLVLTIGYLIVEADEVAIVIDSEHVVPARVVAYDQATGFGLVQALVPLRIAPVPLGNAQGISSDEALMISSGGVGRQISIGRMVSRRDFSGYWEYHIDGALFTSPPRTDHSGAGLFNADGELVGIGSLVVLDALGPGKPRLPGNMFVPVDLLKPILQEMRSTGATSQSHRAWLGVNCVEQGDEVRVLRVNEDSPAMQAGLQPGDRIVRIDGAPVTDLAGFYKSLWSGPSPEREVTLEIARGGQSQTLKVQAQDRMKSFRHAQGI